MQSPDDFPDLENRIPDNESSSYPREKAVKWARNQYCKARWQSRLSAAYYWMIGIDYHLPAFDQARYSSSLCKWQYIGLQSIPIRAIGGSESEAKAFDRSFRPLSAASKEQWQRTFLDLVLHQNIQPAEVVKIDDRYFVQNGLYHISVAHWLGNLTYLAYVTEWELTVEQADNPQAARTGVITGGTASDLVDKLINNHILRIKKTPSRKEVRAGGQPYYWATMLLNLKF